MSKLDQVTLTAGDKNVALPVQHPVLGQPCIDIAKLPKETGCFTYDPGFTATAACKSAITYIDGDAGVLMYRGYPIEQLAKSSNFLEVSYLLMHGELPDAKQFAGFEHAETEEVLNIALQPLPVGTHVAQDFTLTLVEVPKFFALKQFDVAVEDCKRRLQIVGCRG